MTASFREHVLNRLRKTTHERLLESYRTTPHAWTGTEIDIRAMKQLRDKCMGMFDGTLPRYETFYLWAIRETFHKDNRLNANIEKGDDGELYVKVFSEMNICIAVMAPRGLCTPVVAHVEDKRFWEINKAVEETVARTRRGIVAVHDARVPKTFTLNNVAALGFAYGVNLTFGNSIINPPQTAILSLHAPYRDPHNPSQDLPLAPLMLAFHHGYCDADAPAEFLASIVHLLEQADESVFDQ